MSEIIFSRIFQPRIDDLIITLDDGKTVTASTVSGSGGSIDEKYGQIETEYRYYEKSRFENGKSRLIFTSLNIINNETESLELDEPEQHDVLGHRW